MKIKGVPGEYAFRALVDGFCGHPGAGFRSWTLTNGYFFSIDEVKKEYPDKIVKWPVHLDQDGTVYIPDPSEYEDETI